MNTLFYTLLGYVWQYVTNPKAIMALSFFVAILAMHNAVPDKVFWIIVTVYIFSLIIWGIYELVQHYRNGKQGEILSEAISKDTEAEYGKIKNKEELQLINQQMKDSIQLIRKSKLGDKKGSAALYELPWYMVIGNPAAGKSSAIYNSGLRFPFEETHQKMVSAGLSGTRNCDWFFSTEGVLLDTAGQAELATPKTGFAAWFKRKVLNRDDAKLAQQNMSAAVQGVIAKEFQMFYQIVRKRDDQQNKSLLDEYMLSMGQVRSKLNDLRSAGDFGPASMTLAKQTINDQNSVFNSTQKYVDEKMTVGLKESDQQLLHKLLITPLMQSFETLLTPAQDEMNKLWMLQAYQPFSTNLLTKYPFNPSATLQATSNEINQIFGESGSIARFVKEYLDPFVIRRGYTLTSKTWQDLGIGINPQFAANFQNYVSPSNGMATGELNQPAAFAAPSNQSNFQFYPLENQQLLSYTIDIDGQRMVFENGVQQWVNFVWPNKGAIPGARITAIDLEGKTHTIFDEPGEYGINRLVEGAERTQKGTSFEMVWRSKQDANVFVKVNFRLVSGSNAGNIGSNPGYRGMALASQVVMNKAVRVVAAQEMPAGSMPAPASAAAAGLTASLQAGQTGGTGP